MKIIKIFTLVVCMVFSASVFATQPAKLPPTAQPWPLDIIIVSECKLTGFWMIVMSDGELVMLDPKTKDQAIEYQKQISQLAEYLGNNHVINIDFSPNAATSDYCAKRTRVAV